MKTCQRCKARGAGAVKFCRRCRFDVQNNEDEVIILGSYYGGDYVTNKDAREPIEWIVLAKVGNKALLISKYAIDCKRYNEKNASVTWESSTIRKWLNDEFINTAFNSSEQDKIQLSLVQNPDNAEYGAKGGNDTQDKIFLLSIDEVRKYFNNDRARMCKPTGYAIFQGAYEELEYEVGYGIWWLRSPGVQQNRAAVISCGGLVGARGNLVHCTDCGVRPAMWVDVDKIIEDTLNNQA